MKKRAQGLVEYAVLAAAVALAAAAGAAALSGAFSTKIAGISF